MKKLFILAGSTAAAWYLVREARKWYPDEFEIVIGDIFEKDLIPASTLADDFVQLPGVDSNGYYERMLEILSEVQPDFLVPVIDDDLFSFAKDNDDLKRLGIRSLAPSLDTLENLSDKKKMAGNLEQMGIPTPHIVDRFEDLKPDTMYFSKPKRGHGSIGDEMKNGSEFPRNYDFDEYVVQTACDGSKGELTIDVFCDGDELYTYPRKRMMVQGGACVKMIPYHESDAEQLKEYIKKINTGFPLPLSSCAQFMKNEDDQWSLIDFNMRLGAGTPLADAAGFQIGRAMLSKMAGLPVNNDFFKTDDTVRSVLRVYEEVVVR